MEDAFIRKKQPYNLDAEQSVIGSMIMDRDAIVDGYTYEGRFLQCTECDSV